MDPIPQNSPKILILQLRRIGDVVFTLPAVEALHRVFRNPSVDFLVEPPSDALVRLNPFLRRTWTYDRVHPLDWIGRIRREKYDAVLDFHSTGRTLWITALSGAPIRAGFKGAVNRRLAYNLTVQPAQNRFIVDQKMDLIRALAGNNSRDWTWNWNLYLPSAELKRAQEILSGTGAGGKIVGMAPLHRHPIRAWPAEKFAETADRLIREGAAVLLLGGPGEKNGLAAIQNRMKEKAVVHEAQGLLELSALIAQCKAFLANDNGPQKIAMALNVPSLTIFGPTNPLTISINRPPHLSIRDDRLFCIACEKKSCPYRHECMTNVAVDAVLEKLQEILR